MAEKQLSEIKIHLAALRLRGDTYEEKIQEVKNGALPKTEEYLEDITDYIAKWQKTCKDNPDQITVEMVRDDVFARKVLLDEHVNNLKTLNRNLKILANSN